MFTCYYERMMRWRLRDYLNEHNLSAYALTRAADVAPNTVYALARGDSERISLAVFDKVLAGLEKLTGRPVSVADLLERETTAQPKKSWLDLAGSFDDPTSPGDISVNHDKYLSEALLEEHREGLLGKR